MSFSGTSLWYILLEGLGLIGGRWGFGGLRFGGFCEKVGVSQNGEDFKKYSLDDEVPSIPQYLLRESQSSDLQGMFSDVRLGLRP